MLILTSINNSRGTVKVFDSMDGSVDEVKFVKLLPLLQNNTLRVYGIVKNGTRVLGSNIVPLGKTGYSISIDEAKMAMAKVRNNKT